MFLKILLTSILILAVVQMGCTIPHNSRLKHSGLDYSLPKQYQNYYSYPNLNLPEYVVSEKVLSRYTIKTVEIPLSFPDDLQPTALSIARQDVQQTQDSDERKADDFKLDTLNRIDLYQPKNLSESGKRPAILISPILGGTMVVDLFAKHYAKHGFVAAIVHREEIFWNKHQGIEQIEDYLRMSIIRIRQALDWLVSQPDIDEDRIGAFGISYGAIMHSMLAAIDSRVKYHILAMPAAPLSDVIVHCPDRAIKRLIPVAMEQYNDTIEGLHVRLQNTIITDPLLLREGIDPNRIYFYIALFDRIVGTRRSFQQWRAFGKPKLKILPFGHYGGILALPLLQYQTRKIFERQL